MFGEFLVSLLSMFSECLVSVVFIELMIGLDCRILCEMFSDRLLEFIMFLMKCRYSGRNCLVWFIMNMCCM